MDSVTEVDAVYAQPKLQQHQCLRPYPEGGGIIKKQKKQKKTYTKFSLEEKNLICSILLRSQSRQKYTAYLECFS